MYRTTTRGELVNALHEGKKCEVVASNERITTILIETWLNPPVFRIYPSDNAGWVVYEKVKD